MKKLICIIILGWITMEIQAQAPLAFNYQGMALDPMGNKMSNQSLKVRLSLLEGSATGQVVFSEHHTVNTSPQGIFSLKIGEGNVLSGKFADASWGSNTYFLKVEGDFDGNENFIELGISQLVSVPYALHAETVSDKDDADADPNNELQSLSINGNVLSISNGNSVNLPNTGSSGSGDDDPNNEIQDLSVNQNGAVVEMSISKGGKGATFGINDGDFDPTNEIQTLSKSNQQVTLSNGGGSFTDEVDDADSDPLNEIQTLSFINRKLSLSQGNEVDLDSISTPWKRGYGGIYVDDAYVFAMDPVITNMAGFGSLGFDVEKGDHKLRLRGDEILLEPILSKDSIGLNARRNQISIFKSDNNGTRNLTYWDQEGLFFANGNQAKYEKDHLSFVGSNNLGLDIKAKMDPFELRYDHQNFQTLIDAFGTIYTGELSDLSIGGLGFSIFEGLTANSKSLRFAVFPDSLVTFNRNGYRTIFLGQDPATLSGSLSLFEGSLSKRIISLGDNPATPGSGLLTLSANNKAGLEIYMEPLGSADRLAGVLKLHGPNSVNVVASNTSSSADFGRIDIHDDKGSARAGMFVNFDGTGRIYSDVKHFRMDHPEDHEKEIWYASLEGPEAGAYVRGTAKLQKGEIFVPFPDHFKHVANPSDLTVILTPLDWDTYGLAVVKKTTDGIYVKELKGGTGNFSFDWEVKSSRRGFEDYQVILPKIRRKSTEKSEKHKSARLN